MLPLASPRPLTAAIALLLLGAMGCANKSPVEAPPPAADFLVTAGDSAFWVSTTDGRFRIRRAPLMLANFGGRFYELYARAFSATRSAVWRRPVITEAGAARLSRFWA